MNAIIPFSFESTSIRTIYQGGTPWFVGADICAALASGNSRQVLSRLDSDERDAVQIVDTIGRSQKVTIINEPGVYRLIFTSRRPEAERFKRWLAHEVLPELRRTGAYQPEPVVQRPALDSLLSNLFDIFSDWNRISDWSEYVPVDHLMKAFPDADLNRIQGHLYDLRFNSKTCRYIGEVSFVRYATKGKDTMPEVARPVRWGFRDGKWSSKAIPTK